MSRVGDLARCDDLAAGDWPPRRPGRDVVQRGRTKQAECGAMRPGTALSTNRRRRASPPAASLRATGPAATGPQAGGECSSRLAVRGSDNSEGSDAPEEAIATPQGLTRGDASNPGKIDDARGGLPGVARAGRSRRPAAPSSAPNSNRLPSAFHARAEMAVLSPGAVERTRISAPSVNRHSMTQPSS